MQIIASGDLRSVVKTLAALPTTYAGHCQVIVNDQNEIIVFRNAILLLTALNFESTAATAIMIHLWYSALIPAKIFGALRERVLPLIKEVCNENRTKAASTSIPKKWIYGARSIRLILTKAEWNRLRSYFEVPEGLSMAIVQENRANIAPHRNDNFEQTLYCQAPPWRVCRTKFRDEGILLPFGSSRDEFDVPNPSVSL